MADLNTIGGLHYEMMRRCYNKNSVAYRDYGAKGIEVCQEWHNRENFKKWARENGYKKGLRLERIDSKGNYEPSNCRFGISLTRHSVNNARVKESIKRNKELKAEYGIEDGYTDLRLYSIFRGMKNRCCNKNSDNYNIYGGRGIKICDEWLGEKGFYKFYKWSMENGYQDNLSIDRIDNDKGYSPDNCRWVTSKEQVNNRRVSKLFDYAGGKFTLVDIAKMENISYGKLYSRVTKKGMSVYDAMEDIKKKS